MAIGLAARPPTLLIWGNAAATLRNPALADGRRPASTPLNLDGGALDTRLIDGSLLYPPLSVLPVDCPPWINCSVGAPVAVAW